MNSDHESSLGRCIRLQPRPIQSAIRLLCSTGAGNRAWRRFGLRRLIVSVATAVSLSSAGAVVPASAMAVETYVVGVVPQFEARRLADIWDPILAELGQRTGFDFKMSGSAGIPVFEDSFAQGEFDFAYMNPYHFLVAKDRQGYVPLVRDGARQLYGILAVRNDSPYLEVADLQGELISFPAPNALGASLLVRAELTQLFGVEFDAVYAQTHTSAYTNTMLGETAAAGGVMSTFKRQPSYIQDGLRVLHETTRVAPHPFVAHPRVPKQVREMVRHALLELSATPEGQAMLKRVPISSAVPAVVEDYLPLQGLNLDGFAVQ